MVTGHGGIWRGVDEHTACHGCSGECGHVELQCVCLTTGVLERCHLQAAQGRQTQSVMGVLSLCFLGWEPGIVAVVPSLLCARALLGYSWELGKWVCGSASLQGVLSTRQEGKDGAWDWNRTQFGSK